MRHSRFMLAIHWVTMLLVGAAFVIVFTVGESDDPDIHKFWMDWHRTIGLAVLALTVLRFAGRALLERHFTPERLPLLLRLAGGVSHAALYIVLAAMPLLGWAQSSAKAHSFKVFGARLPRLLAYDPDLAERLADWHETLGWAFLGLIGVHVAGALYHHYVRRDAILTAMFGR